MLMGSQVLSPNGDPPNQANAPVHLHAFKFWAPRNHPFSKHHLLVNPSVLRLVWCLAKVLWSPNQSKPCSSVLSTSSSVGQSRIGFLGCYCGNSPGWCKEQGDVCATPHLCFCTVQLTRTWSRLHFCSTSLRTLSSTLHHSVKSITAQDMMWARRCLHKSHRYDPSSKRLRASSPALAPKPATNWSPAGSHICASLRAPLVRTGVKTVLLERGWGYGFAWRWGGDHDTIPSGPWPGMHWRGGTPPPLPGAQPMPSHCPPDAKCQPQWHL